MTNAELLQGKIDTAAMLALWENNSGLIHKAVFKWTGRGIPFEDLEQEAFFALVVAVKRYERTGGKWQFTTNLGKTLNWYFFRYFKKQAYLDKELLTLNAPIPGDESGEAELIDLLPTDIRLEEEIIENVVGTEIMRICLAAIGKLRKDYRDILTYRFIDGLTFPRIAEIMRLPAEQAKCLCQSALRRLRSDYKLRAAIRQYREDDDYRSASLTHTGFKSFRERQASSQELFVLWREELLSRRPPGLQKSSKTVTKG